MKDFCNSFILSYEGKSVETLWLEFKEALNYGIQKFIPSKFVGKKRHLPWITQSIKREIRKRDRLYQKSKRSKDPRNRRAFLNSKHGVRHKLKVAYDMYLEDILGLNEDSGNQTFCRKKLFSFVKSSHADSQSIAVLRKGDMVCTENVGQADLLNSQFQSVFSIRSPLDLAKLCPSKILNGTTSLLNLLPESMSCKYPTMPDFEISSVGVAKLLSNLNVAKLSWS